MWKKTYETWCEKMEKESTGERGMGVRYKGSLGQIKRTVELQEEEKEERRLLLLLLLLFNCNWIDTRWQ
jgi:hypothetical protein